MIMRNYQQYVTYADKYLSIFLQTKYLTDDDILYFIFLWHVNTSH